MTHPWQDEKWWEANKERLKALHKSSTPWNVRDLLGEYIQKLERATDSNKEGGNAAPIN